MLPKNYGNAFKGDVLVIHGPSNKNQNSPFKTNILHADLVDKDGDMTSIASVNDNLIKRFGSFLQPGKSVRIRKFGLKKKGQYERGDAKYSIVILANKTIETIDIVCTPRRLPLDMTITELLFSNDNYAVGTIAAIVIAAQHNNRQFEFYIKDGETENNHATVKTCCLL